MEANSKFFKMYQGVLSIPKVSLDSKVLLSLILSFNESGRKAFMSNQWLADKLQVSTRSIRRYLKELETADLITRTGTANRTILPGRHCPQVWSVPTSHTGHNRPSATDKYDHILDSLNKSI